MIWDNMSEGSFGNDDCGDCVREQTQLECGDSISALNYLFSSQHIFFLFSSASRAEGCQGVDLAHSIHGLDR